MRYHRILGAMSAAALLGFPAACSDLEEDIVSDLTLSYYETPEGVLAAVDAAYSELREWYGTQEGLVMMHFGTDLWEKGNQAPFRYYNDYNPQLDPQNSPGEVLWDNYYEGINIANAVTNRAPAAEMDEALKARKIGEARFLRAVYYFDLVRTFGDVHLTLEETKGVQTEATRTPAAEIYRQAIIPDLEYAIQNLPARSGTDFGRATIGAARHLLALVYLTRAEPGDFEKAFQQAKAVIDSGEFRLLDDYADLWPEDNQENEEIIFSIQYGSDPRAGKLNWWHMFWLPKYDNRPGLERVLEYGKPWVRIKPTDCLLGLWDRDHDSRYEDSFQHLWLAVRNDGDLQVGDTAIWLPTYEIPEEQQEAKDYIVYTPSEYYDDFYPGLIKHRDTQRSNANDSWGTRDIVVYRLAGTYLLAAEALIRDGRAAEAVPYVDAVRQRAARPGHEAELAVTAGVLDEDFILDERARELAGEGTPRWFDLVRLGVLEERVQACNPAAAPNIQPFHVLRPIPQEQIDLTTTPFEQNPGY